MGVTSPPSCYIKGEDMSGFPTASTRKEKVNSFNGAKFAIHSALVLVGIVFCLAIGFVIGVAVGELRSEPVKAEGNFYYKNATGEYHMLSEKTYMLTPDK